MKKILVFLLFFMGINSVAALDYNNSNVIIQRAYKYYKLDRVNGPYVSLNNPNNDYPYIDKNIYECNFSSDLSIEKPEELDGRYIYEYDGYKYLKKPFIKYMDIISNSGDVNLSNLQFFYDGKLINYNTENQYVINDNEKLRFNFEKEYDPSLFRVQFYLNDNESNEYNFSLVFGGQNDFLRIRSISIDDIMINIDVKYYPIEISNYDILYSTEKLDVNDDVIFSKNIKLYNYKDCMYQSYRYEKNYYNEYLTSAKDDYIYRDNNIYMDSVIYINEISENLNNITKNQKNIDKTNLNIESTNKESTSTKVNNKESTSAKVSNKESPNDYNNETYSIEKVQDENGHVIIYFIFYFLLLLLLIIIGCRILLKRKN